MNQKRIYVSENFLKLIENFRKKFKEINGIDLSIIQATDLIYQKIQKAGGLVI